MANVIPTRELIAGQLKYTHFPERWYLAKIKAYESLSQTSEIVDKEKDNKIPDKLNEYMYFISLIPQRLAVIGRKKLMKTFLKHFKK
ncbi:hypothetical protein Syun_009485 [Stephania yunnanensis]|uniref:Uncharacterized protein n=1 Tax=Stephania yunnanensis TaxID=152371 RepID=A0AAP0KEI8_9MAGN